MVFKRVTILNSTSSLTLLIFKVITAVNSVCGPTRVNLRNIVGQLQFREEGVHNVLQQKREEGRYIRAVQGFLQLKKILSSLVCYIPSLDIRASFSPKK